MPQLPRNATQKKPVYTVSELKEAINNNSTSRY